jgi:uncharacterized membrane protein YidH (DUF202 family)
MNYKAWMYIFYTVVFFSCMLPSGVIAFKCWRMWKRGKNELARQLFHSFLCVTAFCFLLLVANTFPRKIVDASAGFTFFYWAAWVVLAVGICKFCIYLLDDDEEKVD